ncbi:MAG: tRNA (adenosine(37)-N6)-threonylcarbamoyltransferase complex ATPase subunit type 1 TsaE [Lachnospiraceae bacterium]|nr:tRNA (adenosine(37)-N6)-threonylcarbamoyltransferase complex ATPase subunit type 1 TsaE [Lachnospiraceae bacterium]
MKLESNSAEETFEIGKRLGKEAKAGDVFCLFGDLGVGKTVFTKGFAVGLEVTDTVNSPTFTIVQEYKGRLSFYHFDVYRIEEPEEMEEIGYEDYFYGDGVCMIEWAGQIEELLPEEAVKIHISKELQKGTEYRLITIEKP